MVEQVLSEPGIYGPLKYQFLENPVETCSILDKTFSPDKSTPETLFTLRVFFLGSLGNQYGLSISQLGGVCKEIVSRVNSLSWKLERVRLETCLDQVGRLDAKIDPCSLVLDAVIDLFVEKSDICDVELLARFFESINPRFGFASAGLEWLESSFLARCHQVLVGGDDSTQDSLYNTSAKSMMENPSPLLKISSFCGCVIKYAKRMSESNSNVKPNMVRLCASLLSHFNLILQVAKSPVDFSLAVFSYSR